MLSKLKDKKYDYLILIIFQAIFAVAGYMINVYLARKFGPAEYGHYGFLLSVLLWVEFTAGYGFSHIIVKIFNSSQKTIVEHHLGMQFTLSLLLTVIWIAGFGYLAAIGEASLYEVLLPAADIIPFTMFIGMQAVLNGQKRYIVAGSVTLIYTITKLFLTIVLCEMSNDIALAFLAMPMASIITLLYCRKFSGAFKIRIPQPAAYKWASTKLIRLSISLALVSSVIAQLDIWLVKYIIGNPVILGNYIAITNFFRLYLLIARSVSNKYFNEIKHHDSLKDALSDPHSKGFFISSISSYLMLSIVLSLGAEFIINLFFGPKFAAAQYQLMILGPTHGLLIMTTYFLNIFYYIGNPGEVIKKLCACIILYAIIAIPLMAEYGVTSLAIADLSISLLIICYLFFRAQKDGQLQNNPH